VDQYVRKVAAAATPQEQSTIPKDSGGDKAIDQETTVAGAVESGPIEGQK